MGGARRHSSSCVRKGNASFSRPPSSLSSPLKCSVLRQKALVVSSSPWQTPSCQSLRLSSSFKRDPLSTRPIKANNKFLVKSVSDAETTLMRRDAARLLELPLGQMEPSTWYDAEDTIKWWVSQSTLESLEMSLSLLERYVEEAKYNEDAMENLDQFMEWNVTETLIRKWFNLWKSQLCLEWNPIRFLTKLDQLASAAPKVQGLQIGGGAISYVIIGLLDQYEPGRAAVLADELLRIPFILESNRIAKYLINAVLNAWSKSGRSDAVSRAEDLFARIREHGVWTDDTTYNTMLNCYAQAGDAESAESLLLAMTQEWLQDNRQVRPNQISFSTVASAWANSGDPKATERVTLLLKRMLDVSDPLGELRVHPNTSFFNNILDCWSKSNQNDAAEQVHSLLCEMNKSSQEDHGYPITADTFSYAICVEAFAKKGDIERATSVANELVELFRRTQDERVRPRSPIFTSIINALIRFDVPDKQEKVQKVMDDMHELHLQGIMLEGANTWACNQMLLMIASSNDPHRAEKADDFLQRMKERERGKYTWPSGWSYTTVILSWLERPDGVDRAEQLLAEAFDNPNLSLHLKTPARVVHALAKTGNVDAADKWLHRIYDAFEDNIFGEQKPSLSLLGAVIFAWLRRSSQDRDAGFRAETLMNRVLDINKRGKMLEEPEPKMWGALVIMLARTRDLDAARRGHDILQRLRAEFAPYESVFAALIQAYSGLQRPSQAEGVLMEMLDDFGRGSLNAKPDVESFNSVLMGWKTHGNPVEALKRAEALLHHMNHLSTSSGLDVRPNRRSYHFLMNICERIPNSSEKIRLYFEEMRVTCRPGNLTYKFLIQALSNEGKVRDAEAYLHDAWEQHRMGLLPLPPSRDWFEDIARAKKKLREERQSTRSEQKRHEAPADNKSSKHTLSTSAARSSL